MDKQVFQNLNLKMQNDSSKFKETYENKPIIKNLSF
jgi:hypothetical protein